MAEVTFVGRERCVDCHEEAYEQWLGSNHDNAMAVASEQTVLGDFDNTEFEHGGVVGRGTMENDEMPFHGVVPEDLEGRTYRDVFAERHFS